MAEPGGIGRCRILLDSALNLITLAFATTCHTALLDLDNRVFEWKVRHNLIGIKLQIRIVQNDHR